MRVDEYYKIVIPHRYWTTEFKLNSIVLYGVCDIGAHPIVHPHRRRRPRVYACGFHLTEHPCIYAPVWPGHKPDFTIVGKIIEKKLYLHLPSDVIKKILKYL